MLNYVASSYDNKCKTLINENYIMFFTIYINISSLDLIDIWYRKSEYVSARIIQKQTKKSQTNAFKEWMKPKEEQTKSYESIYKSIKKSVSDDEY